MTTPDATIRPGEKARDAIARVVSGPAGTDQDRLVRRRAVHKIKADAAADRFRNHPGRNMDGRLVMQTRNSQVTMTRVEAVASGDDTYLEIWTGGPGTGPPHYRIFNPPTLVQDPRGDITIIAEGQTRRFREDPLGAIAEAIAGVSG